MHTSDPSVILPRRKRRRILETKKQERRSVGLHLPDIELRIPWSPSRCALDDHDLSRNDKTEREDSSLKMQVSLPILLAKREQGLCSRSHVLMWQQRMIMTTPPPLVNFRQNEQQKRDFRAYARRQINFTSLQTPMTDAVLGLDKTGSYIFCLGEDGDAESEVQNGDWETTMALRIYGAFLAVPIAENSRLPLLKLSRFYDRCS